MTTDLAELRIPVELALVDLAMTRLDTDADAEADADVEKELHAAIDREHDLSVAEFADGGHDLHGVVAGLAGNRALELVALVLIRLMRLQVEEVSDAERARAAGEVSQVHAAIAEAMTSDDRELAQHRMRRHLEVLARHLQERRAVTQVVEKTLRE